MLRGLNPDAVYGRFDRISTLRTASASDAMPFYPDATHGGNMAIAKLLAILAVPREKRIRCQAPGCNHSVYRAIHVIQENEILMVLGSTCCRKLYKGLTGRGSEIGKGSVGGKSLSDDEVELLLHNTRELIERLQRERDELNSIKTLLPRDFTPLPVDSEIRNNLPLPPSPPLSKPSSEVKGQRMSESEAKAYVSKKFNVNPDLAGWSGLVKYAMKGQL
jgi:hypothetical protein